LAKSEQEIISDIQNYIKKEGSSYKQWYVGITNDVDRRLFGEHNVNKEVGWWIFSGAASDTIARRIEQYFLNLGCDGGPGGGDKTANIVYAYKKTSTTKP
jgi:hypothetical protein